MLGHMRRCNGDLFFTPVQKSLACAHKSKLEVELCGALVKYAPASRLNTDSTTECGCAGTHGAPCRIFVIIFRCRIMYSFGSRNGVGRLELGRE